MMLSADGIDMDNDKDMDPDHHADEDFLHSPAGQWLSSRWSSFICELAEFLWHIICICQQQQLYTIPMVASYVGFSSSASGLSHNRLRVRFQFQWGAGPVQPHRRRPSVGPKTILRKRSPS